MKILQLISKKSATYCNAATFLEECFQKTNETVQKSDRSVKPWEKVKRQQYMKFWRM